MENYRKYLDAKDWQSLEGQTVHRNEVLELRRVTRENVRTMFEEEKHIHLTDDAALLQMQSSVLGPSSYMYTAHLPGEKDYLGSVTSTDYGGDLGIEIGIQMREHLQNKGYGTKSLELFVEYLRSQTDKKIWLSVDVENKRAVHVYKSVGFVREKTQTYIASDETQRLQHIMILE